MIDREKVIKAFEICYTSGNNCTVCPLFQEDDCNDKLMRDVLSLLKEQEPRVLTLAEVRDEYEVVWLETKYLQPTAAILDHGESNAKWLCVVFGADNSYTSSWRSYGKKWRCWSIKPTEEQRKAVKWDD